MSMILMMARARMNHQPSLSDYVWRYTFSGDGSFTLPSDLDIRILAVGGGAAGGNFGGGGGGGGGVATVERSVLAGSYSVVVGLGGTSTGGRSKGLPGGTTTVGTFMTATGGEGGDQGSGGAAGGDSGQGLVDGVVQNAKFTGLDFNSGGGAGAGMNSPANRHGGDGLFIPYLGEYFGGGGGGCTNSSTIYPGGLGGGGFGRNASVGPGENGKGGGAGGQWNTGVSAPGGSGIVIVDSPVQLVFTGLCVESII